MQVVEIFKSIDGEGKRAGLPATFIRLAGCNCRCSYCDTEYSFNMNDAKTMTVEEIVDAVEEIGIPEEMLPTLAKQAINDACTPGNPREVTVEDITKIYQEAYR